MMSLTLSFTYSERPPHQMTRPGRAFGNSCTCPGGEGAPTERSGLEAGAPKWGGVGACRESRVSSRVPARAEEPRPDQTPSTLWTTSEP